MNYVKTKLKLEMMDEGEQLEVWLDAGDPIRKPQPVPVVIVGDQSEAQRPPAPRVPETN